MSYRYYWRMTLPTNSAFDYSVPGVYIRRWKLFMYFVRWDMLRLNKEGVTRAVGVSTRYGPDGSGFELGGRGKFRTCPDRPPRSTQPPSWWVSEVKRPRHDVDHPPPSVSKVKERVELYPPPSSLPSWHVVG